MAVANSSYRNLGRLPVPGARPAGHPARYEPDFEALTEETGKLGGLESESVDWPVVVDSACRLLRDQSKDMLVACYLCRGLTETSGYEGLDDGLNALADLVEYFWDTLFPPLRRRTARLSALHWLFDALVGLMERDPPSAASMASAGAALANLDRLQHGLNAHFESRELAPLSACRKVLADGLVRIDGSATGGVASKVNAAGPSKRPAGSEPERAANGWPDISGSRVRRRTLLELAAALRRADLADPLSYRVLRAAAWGEVIDYPPRDSGARTHIPPVSPERSQRCLQLLASGEYGATIEAIEEGVARAPFWLDGQRMAANALAAAGHVRARRAVEQDTRNLLTDLPDLVNLHFSNGEPLADPSTLDWLAQLKRDAFAPDDVVTRETAHTPPDAPTREALVRRARNLAEEGRFETAVHLFAEGIATAGTARERFLWQMARAKFFSAAGHYRLALAQLDYLDIQIERHDLADWEPDLAVGVARALLECYKACGKKLEVNAARTKSVHAALDRLARLDPMSALSFAELRIR